MSDYPSYGQRMSWNNDGMDPNWKPDPIVRKSNEDSLKEQITILKAREQKLLEVIDMMKTTLSFYSRKDADQITDVCIWQGEGCAAGWSVVDQGDKANEALAKVDDMMRKIVGHNGRV